MQEKHKVLKEYRVTEKANTLASYLNQHTFEIFPGVNRKEVAHAVEKMFKVKVESVNILWRKAKIQSRRTRSGRPGKKSAIKKAIVTLKKGHKIEIV